MDRYVCLGGERLGGEETRLEGLRKGGDPGQFQPREAQLSGCGKRKLDGNSVWPVGEEQAMMA